MKYLYKKKLGQHFLIDKKVIQSIIEIMHLQMEDKVIEIGPGFGSITNPLLNKLNNLTVIEIDTDLVQFWKKKILKN